MRTPSEITAKLHTLSAEQAYYQRATGALAMLRLLHILQRINAPAAAFEALRHEFAGTGPEALGAQQAYRWFHGSEVDLLHIPRRRLRP